MKSSETIALILVALAVYRLSRLIADEEGPWAIFTAIRNLAEPDTIARRGLECIMCVSVWVALPASIFVTVLGYADPLLWPATWLALSAVTVLIRKWEQKR